MIEAATYYEEACLAGDIVAWVARSTDEELRKLSSYVEHRVAENPTKGGIPALVKWVCVIEASKRFLHRHPAQ